MTPLIIMQLYLARSATGNVSLSDKGKAASILYLYIPDKNASPLYLWAAVFNFNWSFFPVALSKTIKYKIQSDVA